MKKIMLCQVLLVCLLITVDTRSLQKVSDKNVTKRAANGEFFPDWVPFKNKHGEELGEFVQVDSKKKPKKRLALPVNFKLKAVAAPDNEYDDFGAAQGEGEGEDFEKKEWSDLNRPASDNRPLQLLNHTDISDIDGVVNIITQPKPSIVHLINVNKKPEIPTTTEKPETKAKIEVDDYVDQSKETEAPKKVEKEGKVSKKENEEKEEEEDKKNSEEVKDSGETEKPQNEDEYEDEQKAKEKDEQTEKERKESEARKALILDAVDELKARHQAEQRILSEKAKEDEIFKEEHERDKIDSEEGQDKYDRKKPKLDHYDDYDDSVGSSTYDKYKINLETTTVKTTTTTTLRPTSRRLRKPKKRTKLKSAVPTDSGKLSVFKNPDAYIIKEEEPTTTTTTTIRPRRRGTTRFSSRYTVTSTTPRNRDEFVRISLVPESSDSEGSPTLFFPQTKNKRKKKRGKIAVRVNTPSPDSHVAETVENKTAKNLTEALEFKISGMPVRSTTTEKITTIPVYIDTTGLDSKVVDTNTGPSGPSSPPGPSTSDVVAISSDAVSDVLAASTDKKEDKKGGNYEHKRGGGRDYSSSHEEVHEEHGKKAYEGRHEDTRQAKGHHDKEDHSGEYVDRAGTDKKHHDESKHYGLHHHEEHGKKHAKYEESGKHSKGHSTKGSHDIHKKEEYEKRVEFFEEDGDSSEEEKHGGYNHEREHSSGGHFKKGKLEAAHHHHDKGDTGHHLKGGHAHGHKGHKQAGGHDSHGRHHEAKFEKHGHMAGKKWAHAHASPGKVANLVAVDSRANQYYNGPQYYG